MVNYKNNSQRAFTFVEMAVVLTIIGILITLVTGAVSAIDTARLNNARTITAKSNITQIDGMVAWYETSLNYSLDPKVRVDGETVDNWYDISPSSIVSKENKLIKNASGSITYKKFGINNIPSIQFNGTSYFTLSALAQGEINKSTIFFVFQREVTNSLRYLLDSATGTSYGVGVNDNYVNFKTSILVNTGTQNADFTSHTPSILVVYLNNDYSKAYDDNAELMVGNTVVNTDSHSLNGLTIGALQGGLSHFIGQISEIIIFNRPLLKPERKDILIYLSKKYNIRIRNL